MEKDKILGLIIIILSPFEFIPLIIYFWSYGAEYSYRQFMEDFNDEIYKLKLESKEEDRIINAFERLFHKYGDSSGISGLGQYLTSFAINTVIFGLIIPVLILQCPNICKNGILAKTIASIILLVIAFLFAILYDSFAFDAKYKLDLNDDEIYIYPDKFNKEVKENLDSRYNRRKNMIICAFLAQSVMIIQAILVILKYRFTDKKQNVQMNFVQYPPYLPNAPINQANMQGIQTI